MERLNRATTPQLAKLELGRVVVNATKHARDQAVNRNMTLPSSLFVAAGDIVELEHEGKTILKVVVRKKDVAGIDNVYVLANPGVKGVAWTLLTCYVNQSDDNHATIRMDRLGRVA